MASARGGVILVRACVIVALLAAMAPGPVRADSCPREAFEQVVDEASSMLVALNRKNTPDFQTKLRQLRDKRGWSHEQLVKEGAPFVQDATIAEYDATSQQLLMRLNTQSTEAADCRMLSDLRATMTKLVETQTAKWSYMFAKIEAALAQ
jgi:hypothetical protein